MTLGQSTESQLTASLFRNKAVSPLVDQHLAEGLLCALASGFQDQEAQVSAPGIEDAEDYISRDQKRRELVHQKKRREEGPAELDGVALLLVQP